MTLRERILKSRPYAANYANFRKLCPDQFFYIVFSCCYEIVNKLQIDLALVSGKLLYSVLGDTGTIPAVV
jgi:hypothetical protein